MALTMPPGEEGHSLGIPSRSLAHTFTPGGRVGHQPHIALEGAGHWVNSQADGPLDREG